MIKEEIDKDPYFVNNIPVGNVGQVWQQFLGHTTTKHPQAHSNICVQHRVINFFVRCILSPCQRPATANLSSKRNLSSPCVRFTKTRRSTSTAWRVASPLAPCARCSGHTKTVRLPLSPASTKIRRYRDCSHVCVSSLKGHTVPVLDSTCHTDELEKCQRAITPLMFH